LLENIFVGTNIAERSAVRTIIDGSYLIGTNVIRTHDGRTNHIRKLLSE
jgi:hypothetical protein